MKRTDFFAEMAIVTELLMAQRGVNLDCAFDMCNRVLTEVTNGAAVVDAWDVGRVLIEVRSRLCLNDNKGGAR